MHSNLDNLLFLYTNSLYMKSDVHQAPLFKVRGYTYKPTYISTHTQNCATEKVTTGHSQGVAPSTIRYPIDKVVSTFSPTHMG